MQHWDRQKYRKKLARRVSVLMLVIGSVAFISGKSRSKDLGKAPRLQNVTALRIDGLELSGLKTSEDTTGTFKVALVGDRSSQVHDIEVSADLNILSASSIEFGKGIEDRFAVCQNSMGTKCQDSMKLMKSQWEAIAIDGSGRNFLLQEYSQAIVVMDGSLTSVQHVLNFDFGLSKYATKKRSKRYRNFDDSLSSEGFLLLKNGHVLIAKEKSPSVLAEFAPSGSFSIGVDPDTLLPNGEKFEFNSSGERTNLVIVNEWQIAGYGKCDISDLASDRHGSIFVLSENCGTVLKLDQLKINDPIVVASKKWRLPKVIKHPEGLSIDSQDRFWIANDVKDQSDNVFIVTPNSSVE